MEKVDCQKLGKSLTSKSFTATNENLSLLWKLAATSYDKINENIQVPTPRHAWQKHVLSFLMVLHLSALRTIRLHRFHLLFSWKTVPISSKKTNIHSRKKKKNYNFCIGMTYAHPYHDFPWSCHTNYSSKWKRFQKWSLILTRCLTDII